MTLSTSTWTVIDADEFSDLVTATYGRPYCLGRQADTMGVDRLVFIQVPNRGEHDSDPVAFQQWLDADPQAPIKNPRYDDFVAWAQQQPTPQHLPAEYFQPGEDTHSKYWELNMIPPFGDVIDDLAKRGLLTPGEYVIHES